MLLTQSKNKQQVFRSRGMIPARKGQLIISKQKFGKAMKMMAKKNGSVILLCQQTKMY